MRFFKYLLEQYKASPKEIKAAAKKVAKRLGTKNLIYIGAEDYNDLGKMFYFNVMDPKHSKYKSTIGEIV